MKTYRFNIEGKEFTRTTARTYTHAVVCKHNYEQDIAAAKHKALQVQDRKNHAFYKECLAKGDTRWAGEEKCKRIAATTVEEYVASQLKQRIDSIETYKAAGHYDQFFVEGWCGRLDLAQKLQRKALSRGMLDVRIVEVAL